MYIMTYDHIITPASYLLFVISPSSDLSKNMVSGSIPDEICGCSLLETL